MTNANKIIAITLDETTGGNLPQEIVDDQARAINDLLLENEFALVGVNAERTGPYSLNLKVVDAKLVIQVCNKGEEGDEICDEIGILLKAFRGLMKDYAMVCDSYYKAVKAASVQKIEALDMGRRGLHDEGAEVLQEHMEGQAQCDFQTARRLFTLVYALYVPGLR